MDRFETEFEDLDNPQTYAVDPKGFYKWIFESGKQLEEAVEKHFAEIAEKSSEGITHVTVCGMGGSAIAGDVLYGYIREQLPVPYNVIRGYEAPSGLGPGTLLIAISYSGNTEETISLFEEGIKRGAKIAVICSGGKLEELAKKHDCRLIKVRDDIPAPRLALPTLLAALASVLNENFTETIGIKRELDNSVKELNQNAEEVAREIEFDRNPAKKLARDIHSCFPILIGTEITYPAAFRFMTQLNENAKWPCHATSLPEMSHNEIVAYSQANWITKKLGIIFLRHTSDNERIKIRQDEMIRMFDKKAAFVREFMTGSVMSSILFADFVSYYLACAQGLDPSDISPITDLKEKLNGMR
ncbi:MAG: bifunctional phosphoglucose/phosphomannose isomerase [bacterium]